MASKEPQHGKRLLAVIVDELAKATPNRVWASIPNGSDPKDGFLDVTYAELGRAINRTAAWLEDTFGKSSSFETLAYIGLFDVKYHIMVIAATKVGYKVSFALLLEIWRSLTWW